MPGNEIAMYFHCRKCVQEIPSGESAETYQNVAVGANREGQLVIWCRRHDMLVGRFDLAEPIRFGCELCGDRHAK